MHHLHGIYRFTHIKATRLLQRPQIPPPNETIFRRADPDDATLSFVPDEGTDGAPARVAVGVVAEYEGLCVWSTEVEEPDFLFVSALHKDKQLSEAAKSWET